MSFLNLSGLQYFYNKYIKTISSQIKSLTQNISTITSTLGQKLNVSDVANNLTTTASGKALDARQGKTLNDKFSKYLPLTGGTISGNITTKGHVYMSYDKKILWNSKAQIFSNGAQHLYMMGDSDGTYALHLGVHDNTWALDPDVNGMLGLGTANHKWNSIYATTGSINTSDRNMKNSIKELDDRYIQLFTKLLPVSFKFNDGTSGRTHIGFIAQDVEQAMNEVGLTDLEFAGFCRDQKTIPVRKTKTIQVIDEKTGKAHTETVAYTEDHPVEGEYIYSLRYEEFIALNTVMIQKLDERISALESLLCNQKKD